MVYECDNCEAVLGPGLTVCPRCGQAFDEPVPADALWDGAAPALAATVLGATVEPSVSAEAVTPEAAAPEAAAPEAVTPEPVTLSGPQKRSLRWPPSTIPFALLGLCWLGYRCWNPPPVPAPAPVARPSTDLAAHPQYAANMMALVQKLRATGVGAEWPAFGSDDVLLITPQARAAELPLVWDGDMDRRLAQGIYGEFAQTRFESGFPDGDTTACFVLVTGTSGQVVAADFMGKLE